MTLSEHELQELAALERELVHDRRLRDVQGRFVGPRPSAGLAAAAYGLTVVALVLGCVLVVVGQTHQTWLSALGALLAGTSPFLAAIGTARRTPTR